MNWRGRRRIAWMLFVLSCALLAAVPLTFFVVFLVATPLGFFGVGEGAYAYRYAPDLGWGSLLEWPYAIKNTDHVFLPTIHRGGVTVTIPAWIVFAISAAVTIIAFRRSRMPVPPGHCDRCGYNLTGNTTGVCPECGTAVKSKDRPA